MDNLLSSFLVGATGVALVEGIFKVIEKLLDKKGASIKEIASDFKSFKTEVESSLKELKKKDASNIEAQKQTLYFLIHERCRRALSDDEISEEDWKALNDAWFTYHDTLGGNGYLDDMMKKVAKKVKYK